MAHRRSQVARYERRNMRGSEEVNSPDAARPVIAFAARRGAITRPIRLRSYWLSSFTIVQGNLRCFARLTGRETMGGQLMRTSVFAIIMAFGTVTAIPALAQQPAAPGQQMQPGQQSQEDADKGIKTRNSGESGYVADQEKPGAAAHPPGQPDKSSETTGTSMPSARDASTQGAGTAGPAERKGDATTPGSTMKK
jgi:hypothetical protein